MVDIFHKEIAVFDQLEDINTRPEPFQFYTAEALWTDEHTSKKMLEFHLNESVDLSSRNTAFINRSTAWIVSRFDVKGNTNIADFGCGPGLYSIRLAKEKANVTGIDFSANSIRYARNAADREGLKIEYHHQNYLEFDTEKQFDLIIMIFCDFCALSPIQRKTILDKFYRFLKPGASVLLDVHSLNMFNAITVKAIYERNLLDHFWSPNDYFGFLSTFKYETEKVTLDKYTIIEENRTHVIYNWLQHFSRESLTKEFEGGGLIVEGLYSDVCGKPFSEDTPDMAIVARKP
jgi:2-polyprenyl-3-methyl-5-hydroxy-6-metoxy-1,4-benzoquinol methylase